MLRLRSLLVLFCMSILFISCDQVTKNLAKRHLNGGEPLSYFNNTLRLVYAENTGAFLSMGDDWPKSVSVWIFTVFPLVVLTALMIFVVVKKNQLRARELWALLLIFSGGIGNLIDRVINDRHVVDFMNLGIASLRTGIFNVADVYVTTGALLMFAGLFKKRTPVV